MSELPAYRWEAILKRLQSIAVEHPVGSVRVEVQLMLLNGDPVMWFEPTVNRLEPKKSGRQFLEMLRRQYDAPED